MEEEQGFNPHLSEISLVFTCGEKGTIKDLRRGIRTFLTRFYGSETAFRLSVSPNFNTLLNRRGKEKCILLTSDGSTIVEGMLMDLYARACLYECSIDTSIAKYIVSIEGCRNQFRLQSIAAHYFWLSHYFPPKVSRGRERHLMN